MAEMQNPSGGNWFNEQGPPNVGPMAPNAPAQAGQTAWGTSGAPVAPTQGGQQGGGYQRYSDDALQDILHKYPPTYDGVRAASVEVDRIFGPGVVKLLDHPTKLDKFQLPDGRVIDTVIGAGGGNPSWTWAPESGGGGGGGTLGGLSGAGVSGVGQQFGNMLMGSAGAVGPMLGDPMAGRPITDDPSYQFRLGEGMKALERSAAARGTLLTGGAAKAMQRYAQDTASTEYQNSYARRASEQGNNYNRLLGLANFASGEQQNQFGRLYQTANLGLNATNNAQQLASGYTDNIGNAQIGIGNGQANATAYGADANANTLQNLGNIGGQWLTDYYKNRKLDPNNTGGWVDQGRGLY